jgi:hypothetical protein
MSIDVDGAPNAYGPKSRNKEALDYEANAHEDADEDEKIAGYLTKNDDDRTPIVKERFCETLREPDLVYRNHRE